MTSPPGYVPTMQSESRRDIRRAVRLPRAQTEEAIRLMTSYGIAATHGEALAKIKDWFASPEDLHDWLALVRHGRLRACDPRRDGIRQR